MSRSTVPNSPSPTRRTAAIIVAAGRGERAGDNGEGPKQYRCIGGKPVIRRTLDAFIEHRGFDAIAVAIHPDDKSRFAAACEGLDIDIRVVPGGATRQESCCLALLALEADVPDVVLIHDAVRPFIDKALIDRVIDSVEIGSGALPAVAVSDTLKRQGVDRLVEETIARENLYAAQTPQGFPFRSILDAHEKARRSGINDFTDDASIAEWAGLPVRLVEGSPENTKLTWARDLVLADKRLRNGMVQAPDVRTATGYDVHALTDGGHVMLCGVRISHDKTLSGHSDADVGLHALTDALLGTCGSGDIGTHFPPSDLQWKGAASHLFVEHAVELVRARGGRIANADITLICESPKIGPHRNAMVEAMAEMLKIASDRISIKATTNEKLGFLGRGEGIAALATATVVYPGVLPD